MVEAPLLRSDRDDLLRSIAHDIWSFTGSEEARCCGAYEPCAACMKVTYLPAAEAVLATIEEAGR